jgi:hypothetical protein
VRIAVKSVKAQGVDYPKTAQLRFLTLYPRLA